MEYIFNSSNNKYDEKLDKLDVLETNRKSRIVNVIRKNKFFSLVLISLIVFVTINFYLIYSFIKMLESI